MQQKTFTRAVSYLLLLVSLAHLARIIWGWEVSIQDWTVPVWFSYVAVVVAGILSFQGLKFSGKLR